MLNKIKHLVEEHPSEKKTRNILPKMFSIILTLLVLAVINRALILVAIFEVVDFIKHTIKFKTHFFPIDFHLIFGITVTYFYSPVYGFMIILLAQINRFIFGFFDTRYFTESIRSALLFLIIPFFKMYPYYYVAIGALTAKYIIHYATEFIVTRRLSFDKIYFHSINYIGSWAIFYFFDKVALMLALLHL
jgi:hypothetical protein